jgi:hypothetical protein
MPSMPTRRASWCQVQGSGLKSPRKRRIWKEPLSANLIAGLVWGHGEKACGLLFNFDRGVPVNQFPVFDQSLQVLVSLLSRTGRAPAALEALA